MESWSQNPWRRLGLSARAGWLVVGGYGLALVIIAARYLGGWSDTYREHRVDATVLLVCVVAATACAGWAARSAQGRRRYGWLALAVSLAAWTLAEVLRLWPEIINDTYPTPADLVLLIFPIAAAVSLVCLSEHSGQSRWRLILDGVIVATSLLAVSWIFMLDGQLGPAGLERWGVLAHVAFDVGLVTIAILMWSRSGSARPSLNLVVGGMLTICAADITLVYLTRLGGYHNNGLVDLVRVAGLGMLALAALSSLKEPVAGTSSMEVRSRARLWLPYLPVLVAGGVGLGAALRATAHGGPLFAMVAILVVSVLARQFVVLVENQGLLSTVARAAFHDSLTGLPNRAQFHERLERALERRRQGGPPVAVLCLDLDKFKAVNDVLGHPAGDELLIRVAGRLTNCVGDTWTVARLGGDEFAVLVEGPLTEAQASADRILLAFNASIMIEGVPLTVRPSIGLTAVAQSDSSVDELLRHADLAMYAAKRDGGGCVRSYGPGLPIPLVLPQLSTVTTLVPSAVDIAVVARPLADTGDAKEGSDGVRSVPRGIWIALGLLVIGLIVFAASTVVRESRGEHLFFDDMLYPGMTLLAAAIVAARAWHVTSERWAWALLAAGMATSALGDVVYAAWVPSGQSPSVADPAYLAFYPLVYVGLLLLMRAHLRRVPASVRLDTLVCGLTAAAVGAALTAGPIRAAMENATSTVLVGLVYPWGDLLLVAVAAAMLPIIGWRREFRWAIVLIGLTITAVADTVYLFETSAGAYRVGTSLDVCWPAANLLIAIASWMPSSSTPRRLTPGRSDYAVPVICTVVGLTVAILANDSRVAVALATLGLIAVAARFAVTFRDVSAQADAHAHAVTDDLTGLPNRRSLAISLTAASANGSSSSNRRGRCALLLLDLDDFQEINHHVGRHIGDELLCRIADRLSKVVRAPAQLARTGGDEFAVLLEDVPDLPAVRAYAGTLLESLNAPVAMDQITVQVDASIAIAFCPGHCDHPTELLSLVETHDAAGEDRQKQDRGVRLGRRVRQAQRHRPRRGTPRSHVNRRAHMSLPAQDQRARRQRAQRRGPSAMATSDAGPVASRGVPSRRRTRRADAPGHQLRDQPRPDAGQIVARSRHRVGRRGQRVDDERARPRSRRHDRASARDPRRYAAVSHSRDHGKHVGDGFGEIAPYGGRDAQARRAHLTRRLRHRMVVFGAPARSFGRRTEARQGFRVASGRGSPVDCNRAVDGGAGAQSGRGSGRGGGRGRDHVARPQGVRLQHHAGLRPQPTLARRRARSMDGRSPGLPRCAPARG